jgi:hypothetical protein
MDKVDLAILGILQAAREVEAAPLLKTILHKMVYLLDVYEAEANEGRASFTGQEWRFAHFGPFSGAVADSIDRLAGNRDIIKATGSRVSDDNEYEMFDLARSATTLKELGISTYARLRLGGDLQRFRSDLAGLLDYAYFRTTPMRDASPGNVLAFDACRKRNVADYKPVAMNTVAPDALKVARQNLKSLASGPKRRFNSGPFDETYYRGLEELEGPGTPTGLKGRARIKKE